MSTPHWCYGTCGHFMREQFYAASADLGHGKPEIEQLCAPPMIIHQWWSAYTCPHGNEYWIRPTDAQIAKWMKEAP